MKMLQTRENASLFSPVYPDGTVQSPNVMEALENRVMLSASPVHSVAVHPAKAAIHQAKTSARAARPINIVGHYAGTLTLRTPLTNSNARTGLNIGFSNGASNSFSLANDFASMGFGSPNFIGSSAFVNDAFVAALPSSGFGGSGFLFNGHASRSVTFASFNNGSTTPFNGRVSVTINITSESRAGLVTGDVSVGSIGFFNFTGVIKAKKVTLVFSDGSGFISGKVSQAGLVLNGNFADDAFFDTTRGTIRVVRNG